MSMDRRSLFRKLFCLPVLPLVATTAVAREPDRHGLGKMFSAKTIRELLEKIDAVRTTEISD